MRSQELNGNRVRESRGMAPMPLGHSLERGLQAWSGRLCHHCLMLTGCHWFAFRVYWCFKINIELSCISAFQRKHRLKGMLRSPVRTGFVLRYVLLMYLLPKDLNCGSLKLNITFGKTLIEGILNGDYAEVVHLYFFGLFSFCHKRITAEFQF